MWMLTVVFALIYQFAVVQSQITPGLSPIIFRLDDIQDFFITDTQLSVMQLFDVTSRRGGKILSIGMIAGSQGKDQRLLDYIKYGLSNGFVDVFDHCWDTQTFFDVAPIATQFDVLNRSEHRIAEVLEIDNIGVLVPHENLWDKQNTITVMKQLKMDVISGQMSSSHCSITGDMKYMPAGASTNWHPVIGNGVISNDVIISQITTQLTQCGFAVIMMHPQDFAYANGSTNLTAIKQLDDLIQYVHESESYGINSFSQFSQTANLSYVYYASNYQAAMQVGIKFLGLYLSLGICFAMNFIFFILRYYSTSNFRNAKSTAGRFQVQDFYKTINPFYSLIINQDKIIFYHKCSLILTYIMLVQILTCFITFAGYIQYELIIVACVTFAIAVPIKLLMGVQKQVSTQQKIRQNASSLKLDRSTNIKMITFYMIIQIAMIVGVTLLNIQQSNNYIQQQWVIIFSICLFLDYVVFDFIWFRLAKSKQWHKNSAIWEGIRCTGFADNEDTINQSKVISITNISMEDHPVTFTKDLVLSDKEHDNDLVIKESNTVQVDDNECQGVQLNHIIQPSKVITSTSNFSNIQDDK